MSSSSRTTRRTAKAEDIWQRYSDNWVRHLGVVAERGDRAVRESLEAAGYSSLDSQLIAPLSLLYLQQQRASVMAAALGVSQAYTTKLLNRLENSGYIERVEDPLDRRARTVQLSASGRKLIQSALKKLKAISNQHRNLLGGDYERLLKSLATAGQVLAAQEQREFLPPGLQSELSAVVLSAVSELVQRAIGRLNSRSGHAGLTIAHWRVLHDLGLEGTTNAVLAERQSLSTQAISRTVRELLGMGYIERGQHSSDARVSVLIYSERALALLTTTANNIEALGKTLSSALPAGAFALLCRSLIQLHRAPEVSGKRQDDAAQQNLQLAQRIKSEIGTLIDAHARGVENPDMGVSLFSSGELNMLNRLIKTKLR